MKYALVLWVLWTAPLMEAMNWEHAIEETENVMRLEGKYSEEVVCGQALPEEFDFALNCLYHQLLKHANRRRRMVRQLMTRHPSFEG
jgi:hypothetical protein